MPHDAHAHAQGSDGAAGFIPRPLGLHDLAWSLALSVVAMVAVSLLTEKPSKEVIEAFWGKGKMDNDPYVTAAK